MIDLNRRAREHLRCESELAVVPHAGHLFEEPGTLERVAELARDWFRDRFREHSGAGPQTPDDPPTPVTQNP